MLLEIIIENDRSRDPSLSDLQDWANQYGLTMPVLADPGAGTMWAFADGQSSVGLPFTVLIDHGVVSDTNYPTERDWDRILE